MRWMKYIYVLVVITILYSCKQDKTVIIADDLVGEWIIFKALRNEKITKSLEKGNFVFRADNTVNSNLFGNENMYIFKLQDNVVTVEGHEMIKKMKIIRLQNDSLTITSNIKFFDMKFLLVKKEN